MNRVSFSQRTLSSQRIFYKKLSFALLAFFARNKEIAA